MAGRTDAGVHARGQVAHVDVPAAAWGAVPGRSDRTPGEALVVRLAGVLGRGGSPRGASDVVVRRAAVAPAGFDARFAAVWRRYAYRIADDVARCDPLRRHDVLWHGRPLDVAAMDAAAQQLLGEHDFAAYCKPREGATTIRTLLDLRWRRVPDGAPDGGLVVAEVRADAFCHSMVRALVGACLAVGEGRRPVDWPAAGARRRHPRRRRHGGARARPDAGGGRLPGRPRARRPRGAGAGPPGAALSTPRGCCPEQPGAVGRPAAQVRMRCSPA